MARALSQEALRLGGDGGGRERHRTRAAVPSGELCGRCMPDLRAQGLGTGVRGGIVEEGTTELGRDPQGLDGIELSPSCLP